MDRRCRKIGDDLSALKTSLAGVAASAA
jgi:hypothetical protein